MTDPSNPTPSGGASGRRLVLVLAAVVAAVGVLVSALMWAAADDDDPVEVGGTVATTAPTTPEEGLGEGFAPEHDGRRPLRGFGEVPATITDARGETCEVCLLAALDEAQRQRGLMEVTDPALGGYDGMVFVYDEPSTGSFWMRNTPMPLSIAYFDERGRLVSTTDMDPCGPVGECPLYPAGGPFTYALEVAEGGLGDLLVAEGSTLELGTGPCPLADAGS